MNQLIAETCTDFPDVDIIGGKAVGLFRLIPLLPELNERHEESFSEGVVVPTFFTIPVSYELNQTGIDAIMKKMDSLELEKIAVRSSSPYEDGIDYSFDGCFHTELNVDRQGLIEAIKEVRASALGKEAKSYAKHFGLTIDDRMAVIVQRMVKGNAFVAYSRAPASFECVKVEELKSYTGKKKIYIGGKLGRIPLSLINGDYDSSHSKYNLAEVSCDIEADFGHSVRVEMIRTDGRYVGQNQLSILQARPIVQTSFSEKVRGITKKELENLELVVETSNTNKPGNICYPIVDISTENADNLDYDLVRKLDKQYSEGYILMCSYLMFNKEKTARDKAYGCETLDDITPNKKAVIRTTGHLMVDNAGGDHTADICRQKRLLYMDLDIANDIKSGRFPLKTGEMARMWSDGITCRLYKMME